MAKLPPEAIDAMGRDRRLVEKAAGLSMEKSRLDSELSREETRQAYARKRPLAYSLIALGLVGLGVWCFGLRCALRRSPGEAAPSVAGKPPSADGKDAPTPS